LDIYKINVNNKLQNFVSNNSISADEAFADSLIVDYVFKANSLDDAISVIRQAESILISADMDEIIRVRQLSFLAIFRNSIGYWAKAIVTPNHPMIAINATYFNTPYPKFSWRKFWKAVAVGFADAAGGLAGGLISSPALGAIVGGIVGGACSGAVGELF
jgi:hypothetical protein